MRRVLLALMILCLLPGVATAQFTANSPLTFGPQFSKNTSNGQIGLSSPLNVPSLAAGLGITSDASVKITQALSGTLPAPILIFTPEALLTAIHQCTTEPEAVARLSK